MKTRNALIALFCIAMAAAWMLRPEPISATDAPAPVTLDRKIDYNRDIRPILSDNCYFCHGPDAGYRQGDPPLRLDTKEGLFQERDGTWAIVPGEPEDSLVYMRITEEEEEYRMPQVGSGKKLTEEQIELIRLWIEQGAQFKDHWAYVPPQRPEVPQVAGATVRNDIDRFIVAKLKQHELSPSAEADRVTLIRRLYFDLVGLPPTPQEVDAFVKDQSPDAYERLVERLLSSPHFGERMAVYWLDLVRYADTVGYHSDVPRDVSPYRDWVIDAFNRNMPFDVFTKMQLAGDLFPEPSIEHKIASAYNRLLQTTEEGGAQPKEYEAISATDRVRNVSSVWLGSTMACAQCHDHKFDPFTIKDFYEMAAFFADIQEPPIGKLSPELMLPNEQEKAELARVDENIAKLKAQLDQHTDELAAAQRRWEKSVLQSGTTRWEPLVPYAVDSYNGSVMRVEPDGTVLAEGNNPDHDTYTIKVRAPLRKITAIRLDVYADKSLPRSGPGRAANGNFVLTDFKVSRVIDDAEIPIALGNASASFEQTAEFTFAHSIGEAEKKNLRRGWAISGRQGQNHYAVAETVQDLGDGEEIELRIVLAQNYGSQHTIGRLRISVTDEARPLRAQPQPPRDILKLIATDPEKRDDEGREKLAAYYRTIAPLLDPLRDEVRQVEEGRAELVKNIRKALISIPGEPRMVRVLDRGNWLDETGEVVHPAVPHFMRQIEAEGRANRMDLAEWLVAPDNPLTARVLVNRLWKLFYGHGIARTLEDFGSQGEWPTHPELLDWLAMELIDSGWDAKHMVRLMVTSSAYRQTSIESPELRQIDPFNKLYARQSRFRLDAEFIRDNALAVSGLLVQTIGGDSVKPYQPEGYWEFLNFPKRTYEHDSGEKQYRRGLYTHWQRTFLHPSLLNFDAPSREECVAERSRSNTPQQALTLLNDPTYVEAARVFAERIVREGGSTVEQRLAWAFRTALSRLPRTQESTVLVELLASHRAQFAEASEAAMELIRTGDAPVAEDLDAVELAAWTSVARAILNLHETITRN